MRSQLRRFAAVGVLVTAVDVGVLVVLRLAVGVPVVLADAISITAGAVVSFFANRALTFTHDPHLRWVDEPFVYGLVTAIAGAVDVVVVRLGLAMFDPRSARVLLASKAAALLVAGVVRVVGYRRLLFRRVRAVQHHPDANRAAAPGRMRLSVVVPAYNAAGFLDDTVARLRAGLEPVVGHGELEIVVVDDGSPDDTFAAAQRAGADTVLRLPENRGKGAAVRRGMLAAHGRTVAFTDADLAYDPTLLIEFMHHVEAGWDVVVGSRRHHQTVTLVRAGRLRSLGSRLINVITFAVLLGAYRDTQCGIKAFRSDAAQAIFSVARIDRFAFDIEVFHLVERDRLALMEVPVTLSNTEASTVRVGLDSLKVFADLLRIRRLAGQGAYDEAPLTEDSLPNN